MSGDNDTLRHEALTRREWLTHGGAVIGGGLLAGCTGSGSGGGGAGGSDGRENTTTGNSETSYSVTMEPMGTVEFDAVPESYVTRKPTRSSASRSASATDSQPSIARTRTSTC